MPAPTVTPIPYSVSRGSVRLRRSLCSAWFADAVISECMSLRSDIVIRQHSQCCTLEVVVLAGTHRPQECRKAGESEQQRHRHQIKQHGHATAPVVAGPLAAAGGDSREPAFRRARSALRVTMTEEPDIAAAAISGVTPPAIASG